MNKINVKNILKFCSVAEISTALALLIIPSIISQLLFGSEINELSIVITRFAGICILCFGIACWPKQEIVKASWAMFIYNLFVALFFFYLGLNKTWVGILLWPVAFLHLILAVLILRELFKFKRN